MDECARFFGLRAWPFRIVADPEFAKVWADRSELKSELEKRMRRLRGAPHSTVQLMWADFGAGKSHTLRYLEARSREVSALLPVYTEIPVQAEGIEHLYRGLAAAVPQETFQVLANTIVNQRLPPSRTGGGRDFRQALKLLASSDAGSSEVALSWLEGNPRTPHMNLLRSYGIQSRIDSADRSVEVLAEFVAIASANAPGAGVLWLIDEFQRIADLSERKRESLLKSFVTLFNRCTRGLHMVLSFSVAQPETVSSLLPPDLRSRANTFSILPLPFLSLEDARIFLRDLLASFRDTSLSKDYFLADDAPALDSLLDYAAQKSAGRLTPRVLMEVCDRILFEAYDTHIAEFGSGVSVGQMKSKIMAAEERSSK